MGYYCEAQILITGEPYRIGAWLASVAPAGAIPDDDEWHGANGFDVELPMPLTIVERLDPLAGIALDADDEEVTLDLDSRWVAQEYGCVRIETQFKWEPPLEAFDRIAAMAPQLTFTLVYGESGGESAGTSVWTDGTRVIDRHFHKQR